MHVLHQKHTLIQILARQLIIKTTLPYTHPTYTIAKSVLLHVSEYSRLCCRTPTPIQKYPRKAYRPSARTKTPGSPICHYRHSQSQITVPGVPKLSTTWSTRTPSNPNLRSRCFYERCLVNRLWKQVHLCNYLPCTYPSQNFLWTISPHVSEEK